jgi:hypothetical protein
LCLYFALTQKELKDTSYTVEYSKIKKCDDTPSLLRITDEACMKAACELIDKVMQKFGLQRGRKKNEDYMLPYEMTPPLVDRGLVKKYLAKEKYDEFLEKSNKARQKAQTLPILTHLQMPEKGQAEKSASLNIPEEDIEEVRTVNKATGETVVVRYNKSFKAKLIQSTDETKAFYATLKNEILSYQGTKSTVWWNGDSIHTGNRTIAKFAMHNGVLCLYLALKPSDYDATYQVEVAEGKRYSQVPCMYTIKNARRVKLAIDLICDLARKMNLQAGKPQNQTYYLPYEGTEALLKKGLMKEIGGN